MSIEEGERILRPALAPADWQKRMAVAVSQRGKLLLFPASEMRELARGRGLILMGADEDDPMVASGFSDGHTVSVEGTGRSGKPKTCTVSGKDLEKYKLRRARRGYMLPEKMTPTAIA
jgi:topoisomerase IV subunit A